MAETKELEYKGYWYKIVLWDAIDYLYHAEIKKGTIYNTVYTTGGYLSFENACTAAGAIIDFMIESEEEKD